jgi:hypothetical protein
VKTGHGIWSKTTVMLTNRGRAALDAYTAALRDILGGLWLACREDGCTALGPVRAGYRDVSDLRLRGRTNADRPGGVIDVPKSVYPVLYVLLMVALIVGVDLLFLRDQFWPRLVVNIGIVLVFVVFYLTVLRSRWTERRGDRDDRLPFDGPDLLDSHS